MDKKTYYTTKINEKGIEVIDRVQPVREGQKPLPENKDWKLSPSNNALHPETPIARYDKNMRYLTDEEWLKKQGKKDFRGRWYSKETRDTKLVYDLDEPVDETEWTQEVPLENESYQFFDEANNCWAVDEEKKERADKESKLGKLKAEIQEAERKQYRSWKAIESKTADEEDIKFFNEYEEVITSRRPQVKALEDELKESA
jgi:hypothetical protein